MSGLNIILGLLLIGEAVLAYVEAKIIGELEQELEDAQMWIDPVAFEETDDNYEEDYDYEEGREEWQ